MPSAPRPITSTPDTIVQPYDATDEGPVAGWESVGSHSGPANSAGEAVGDFESGNGWQQT